MKTYQLPLLNYLNCYSLSVICKVFKIIKKITAANGAEKFYKLDNNMARTEGIELAREIDKKCLKAWIGHPYIDVIDNFSEFEMKIAKVLQVN